MNQVLILSILLSAACLHASADETTPEPSTEGPTRAPEKELHPILLFPGTSGSQVDAKLDKLSAPHYYCSKKSDWYNIWLNPSLYLPGIVDCFIDNFRLDFNETTGRSQNRPGVEIRVPGFGGTETIEYLGTIKFASAYMHNLVEALVKIGYVRSQTLRGAPYDFRLAPNENEEYLAKVKNLIEKMYEDNGGKQVILIAHSMGARISYYFLLQQDDAWKAKYIKSWITLAATFGGETGTLEALAAGTFLFVSPHAVAFGDKVIFKYLDRDYTAKDMPEILKFIGHEVGVKLWPAIDALIPELKHPGVDVHCLRGNNTPTVETIVYKDERSYPLKPAVIRGNGDGIVNQVSADACLKWADSDAFKLEAVEFDRVKHIDMVKDKKVLDYVTDLVDRTNKL